MVKKMKMVKMLILEELKKFNEISLLPRHPLHLVLTLKMHQKIVRLMTQKKKFNQRTLRKIWIVF
jgi:hypothetical protein